MEHTHTHTHTHVDVHQQHLDRDGKFPLAMHEVDPLLRFRLQVAVQFKQE